MKALLIAILVLITPLGFSDDDVLAEIHKATLDSAVRAVAESKSKQTKNTESEIGRYQLVPATIKNSIVNEQTIFKIDTATGQAWWFFTMGDTNRNNGAWIPVFETPVEASKELDELDELMKKGNELLKKNREK